LALEKPLSTEKPVVQNVQITKIELMASWTQVLKEADLSSNTIKWYTQDVETFLDWLSLSVGDTYPTFTDVAVFRDALLKERKSVATINRKIASVRRYMNWAIANGAGSAVGQVRSLREVQSPRPALTRSDGMRFLHTVERHASARDRAAVMLMLGVGLRSSEVVQLLVGDVGFSERGMDVHVRAEGSKGNVSRHIRGRVNTKDAVLARIRESGR
jgi:integrase/recombinase XerC